MKKKFSIRQRLRIWLAPVQVSEFFFALAGLAIINVLLGFYYWLNSAGGSGIGIDNFPLDDGWIHLVYVRSLATTGRLDYNPGELEAGMSSLLWVVLNAIFYWPAKLMRLNPTIMPKFLSLCGAIFSCLSVYLILRWRNLQIWLAAAAAILLALDPDFGFSRASGMEVTLFTTLLLLSFIAAEKEYETVLGILLGLCTLTRFEALPAVALLLGMLVLAKRQTGGPEDAAGEAPTKLLSRRFWKITIPFLALVGIWILYCLMVTGHPLPNTFYLKGQATKLLRLDNLQVIFTTLLLPTSFFSSYLGLVLFLLGIVLTFRAEPKGRWWLAIFPLLFIYALSVTHTFIPQRAYYWTRYFHPVHSFLILPMFIGLNGAVSLGRRKKSATFSSIVAATALAVVGLPVLYQLPAAAKLFSTNCRDISTMNVAAGKWLKAHSAEEDWVATMDAGAIRFFSERRVYDLNGLNHHQTAHPQNGQMAWAIGEAITKWWPKYYVLFVNPNYRELAEQLRLQPLELFASPEYSICDCPAQHRMLLLQAPPRPQPTP